MKQTKPIDLESMNYIGPSMNPILKAGDRLEIVSYKGQKFRPGDVIVFSCPDDGSRVVHRAVTVDSHGIKTRGDNCNHIDPWVLKIDQILGRVISVQRGNRRRRIFGGPLGRLFAVIVRVFNAIDSHVSYLLRPAYNELAKKGIFIRLLPAQMRPRVVSFEQATGKELQLLMGRHVVGRWLPGKTGWNIRRPFRLFVDEAALPENPAKRSVVRC